MRHTRLARADRGSTQSGFSVPRPSRSAPTAAAAAAPNRRDPRGDGFASFADAPRASLFALVRRISPRLRSSASVCGAIHRNHARESGSRPTSVARACQLGRPRFACSARKYAEKLFAKTRQRAAGSWNHTSVSYADGARGDGAHYTSAGKMRLTRHGADRRELSRAVRTIASLTSPSTFLSLSGSLRSRAGAGPGQREEGVDDCAGSSAKAR